MADIFRASAFRSIAPLPIPVKSMTVCSRNGVGSGLTGSFSCLHSATETPTTPTDLKRKSCVKCNHASFGVIWSPSYTDNCLLSFGVGLNACEVTWPFCDQLG